MKSTAVYAQPNLLRFICTRMCIVLAMQVQAVALGWFVYAQTGSALSLGLIGLAQFAPVDPAARARRLRRRSLRSPQGGDAVADRTGDRRARPLCLRPLHADADAADLPDGDGDRRRALVLDAVDARRCCPTSSPANSFRRPSPFHPPRCSSPSMVGPAIGGFVYALIAEEIFLVLVALPALAALLILTVKTPPVVEQSGQRLGVAEGRRRLQLCPPQPADPRRDVARPVRRAARRRHRAAADLRPGHPACRPRRARHPAQRPDLRRAAGRHRA